MSTYGISSTLVAVLSFTVLLVLGFLLTVFLIFSIGMRGTVGWHLAMLLSFLIVAGAFLLLRRKRLDMNLVVRLAIELVLFVIILEVPVIFIAPTNSILQAPLLASLGMSQDARTGPCNIEMRISDADAFYMGTVDYDRVKVVHGGMPKNLGLRSGMVIEETIYLEDPPPCISVETFVHESAHIWQFQTGWWYGLTGPFRLASWFFQQAADPGSLYDHGGPSGLAMARSEGKEFVKFGPEQQAMILQDYYRILDGRSTDANGRSLTADYISDLEYFALQVIGP